MKIRISHFLGETVYRRRFNAPVPNPVRNRNRHWGYFDETGREFIRSRFDDDARPFCGSPPARVRLNGKYGYIDTSGREVIPLQYNFADVFYEGLALVSIEGKRGHINPMGRVVIPLQYGSFHKEPAHVKRAGR
jgi:hypothetical protein